MSVLNTRIVGDGDDLGVVSLLVGDVVDGEGILVVGIADIASKVTLVRATVDHALSVVDVAVSGSTARGGDVGRVADVKEDQPTTAGQVVTDTDGLVATDGTSSNGVVELLVDDNVVGAADGELVPMAGKLSLGEVLGVGRVEVEDLLHVEELHTVLDGLGANDEEVIDDTDLTPVGAKTAILGETSDVAKLALAGDLGKGGTVVLTDGDELTAVGRGPAPRRGASSAPAAQVGVGEEVVQVNVVALERVVLVAGDGGSEPVDAGRVAELGVLRALHLASSHLGVPLSLRVECQCLCKVNWPRMGSFSPS